MQFIWIKSIILIWDWVAFIMMTAVGVPVNARSRTFSTSNICTTSPYTHCREEKMKIPENGHIRSIRIYSYMRYGMLFETVYTRDKGESDTFPLFSGLLSTSRLVLTTIKSGFYRFLYGLECWNKILPLF